MGIKSSNGTSSRARTNLLSKKLRIISEEVIMEENCNQITPALADAMSKDMVMAFSSKNNDQMQEKMDDIESNSSNSK